MGRGLWLVCAALDGKGYHGYLSTLIGLLMDEFDLISSKHCQTITRDGKTVSVEIYCSPESDWTLEVVDEMNNSTVWDDQFKTDDQAYEEFLKALEEEGIDAFIGLNH
jgi:hypothetical protein